MKLFEKTGKMTLGSRLRLMYARCNIQMELTLSN
jgi:hypothetical protein